MRLLLALMLFTLFATIGTVKAAPKVVSSIQPVAALVASVMEGVGRPETLLPPSATPHSYALKPSQARALAEAEIVFWVGPSLESFMQRPLANLAANADQIALMDAPGVTLFDFRSSHDHHDHEERHDDHDEDHKDEHDHGDKHDHDKDHDANHADADKHDHGDAHDSHGAGSDPHIWLDPRNAAAMTRQIAAVLIRHDPGNKAAYAANAVRVLSDLEKLETRISELLAPYRQAPLVVFHDAYQYFERRFDLRSVGVIALNPETPPGARRIRELQHRIEETGARCIFFEPQFDGKIAYALSERTGIRFSYLDPMGPLAPVGFGQYRMLLLDMAQSIERCLSDTGK